MDTLRCFHAAISSRHHAASLLGVDSRRPLLFHPYTAARNLQLRISRSLTGIMVVVRAAGVQHFYDSAELETVGIFYHPFVRAALTGTLPPESLSAFLHDEAHLSLAAASLSKRKHVKKLLLKHLGGRLQDELPISDPAEAMRSFMLNRAAESECRAAVVLMAFLHIRVALERHLGKFMPQDHDWISVYGMITFQACVSLVGEDLEAHLRRNKASELEMLFKETLRHQLHVLTAAYSGPGQEAYKDPQTNPWDPSNILFTTDYDVTCTVRDTSEVLVSIAQRNRGGCSSDLEDAYWSLMKLHDTRIKACLSLWEYDSVSAKLTSSPAEKHSPFYQFIPGMDLELRPLLTELQEQVVEAQASTEYKNSNLRGILKQLGDLEKTINKEVIAAGVLRGVRREEIREQVRKIPLHARCAEVLLELASMNTAVHYISATWSRDLALGGLPALPKGLLFIHSNDLEYDGDGVSDGTFQGVVQDAFDKEAILQALQRMYAKRGGHKMTVFLGDSTNDLLALLGADLGIVIGQNPAFREMLSRYKLQLLPLVVASARISASPHTTFRHSGTLFEASGWAEVEACLLRSKFFLNK